MKRFLSALLLLLCLNLHAQYYYLDITGTKQTNQQYQLLRNFNYRTISATGFDGDNEPSKDFVLEQKISKDGKEILTRTASVGNVESFLISSFENNRVIKTVDSSSNVINTSAYEYDNTGRVTAITSTGKDFDGTFSNTETRHWTYDSKGLPTKMLKIKSETDTTVVFFKTDESGNVVEEKWLKKNVPVEIYYYYYTANKQLTDIVRFSKKAKAMLPDFVFEYDDAGRMSQMTQAQGGSANYLIWKYAYNKNGFKIKETVFNKKREFLGKIEYRYE